MPVVTVRDPHDIRIDRKTVWGNPYPMRQEADRDRVIQLHKRWLWAQIREGKASLESLAELDGKRLACHCAPRACHGDTLLAAAAWAKRALQMPAADRLPRLGTRSTGDRSNTP